VEDVINVKPEVVVLLNMLLEPICISVELIYTPLQMLTDDLSMLQMKHLLFLSSSMNLFLSLSWAKVSMMMPKSKLSITMMTSRWNVKL